MEAWLIPIIFVAFLAVISIIVTIALSLTAIPNGRDLADSIERDAIAGHFAQDLKESEMKIKLVKNE
jgi:hypothetical protein